MPVLKPLAKSLYSEIAGRKLEHSLFELGEEAKQAILIWKCALISIAHTGRELARPMESLIRSRQEECKLRVRFDGCPAGVGWVVQEVGRGLGASTGRGSKVEKGLRTGTSVEREVAAGSVLAWGSEVLWTHLLNDPKYQNTAELIGVVLGLGWIASNSSGKAVSVEVVGDSVTVLTWMEGEKFTGLFGRAAAVALMHILSCGRIRIGAAIHVPAEFNELCDDLSRNRIPKSLSGTKRFQNQSLLEIMDPMRQGGGDFLEVMTNVTKALSGYVLRG
jgi:hypothetical protein